MQCVCMFVFSQESQWLDSVSLLIKDSLEGDMIDNLSGSVFHHYCSPPVCKDCKSHPQEVSGVVHTHMHTHPFCLVHYTYKVFVFSRVFPPRIANLFFTKYSSVKNVWMCIILLQFLSSFFIFITCELISHCSSQYSNNTGLDSPEATRSCQPCKAVSSRASVIISFFANVYMDNNKAMSKV